MVCRVIAPFGTIVDYIGQAALNIQEVQFNLVITHLFNKMLVFFLKKKKKNKKKKKKKKNCNFMRKKSSRTQSVV
jgi:hypothetical protein